MCKYVWSIGFVIGKKTKKVCAVKEEKVVGGPHTPQARVYDVFQGTRLVEWNYTIS